MLSEYRNILPKEVIGQNSSVAHGLSVAAASVLVKDENCSFQIF